MQTIIDFVLKYDYLAFALLIVLLIGLILLIKMIIKIVIGNFNEANVFKRLKKIYKTNDYPYIKEIILPINKETYAYYDAIVFGNKFFYLIEIKNHKEQLFIDPLDDWYFVNKKKKIAFTNPFYELELKKHILNRFLEIDKNRLIEVVVYNTVAVPKGNKGKNHLIAVNQINALIKHYEQKDDLKSFGPDFIEKKGNYLLEIAINKKKIRKNVIEDLKSQRIKR